MKTNNITAFLEIVSFCCSSVKLLAFNEKTSIALVKDDDIYKVCDANAYNHSMLLYATDNEEDALEHYGVYVQSFIEALA